MQFIDLTLPIKHGMSSYPGEPGGYFIPFSEVRTGGFASNQILLYTHLGTHIDAPCHFLAGGKGVDSVPLTALIGEAMIVDITGTNDAGEIDVAQLVLPRELKSGDKVILRTGWYEHWGQDDYFTEFPNIGLSLATYLAAKEIALLGMDMPTPHATLAKEVHEVLLHKNIVILEGLANLHQVEKPVGWLTCLPLPLIGLDGSPVRAVWSVCE